MAVCLYLVVPCYNDADTIPVSFPVFLQKLNNLISAGTICADSRLLLVNDGSSDNTWEVILGLKNESERVTAVNLEQNVGEQNALLAGMVTAIEKADCVITMDSDLQDDIATVDEMLRHYNEGCDIVYGVHKKRKEDSLTERFFSGSFYSLMRLTRTGLIFQHANFRLMSRRAVLLLQENQQAFYYLPCVVSNLNVKSTVVYHERFARVAGHSRYCAKTKFTLAVNALLAHSIFFVIALGLSAFIGALLCIVNTVQLCREYSVSSCVMCAVFGLITVFFGVLCLCAVKKRKSFLKPIEAPRYTIMEIVQ